MKEKYPLKEKVETLLKDTKRKVLVVVLDDILLSLS